MTISIFVKKLYTCMLLSAFVLITACNATEDVPSDDDLSSAEGGVFVLCEGNFNAGNASLSYYNPETKTVENGVFHRVNDRKLGDTGQSIVVYDNTAYIAVENSGIIWGIDTKTFKVKGQLTASSDTKIINPRYVHKVNESKAYVTDLYSHYINIFNPQTFKYEGAIDVSQVANLGYCSTEEMVQWGKYVFTNCWSYSNKILVIDTERDVVADSIVLSSWQPKSMKIDKKGKLWVITDGGYSSSAGSFVNDMPHLFRIDAKTLKVEMDLTLELDNANVQIAMNKKADTVYIINNDIYRMSVDDNTLPNTPFIKAPVDDKGKRHKLYGIGVNPKNGDVYVADAVDYRQSGVVYRYSKDGQLIDQFRVGITPNHFAFTDETSSEIIPEDKPEKEEYENLLVDRIYEYVPAPGHQVNGYTIVGDFIRDGATMQEACDSVLMHFKKQHMVSLGAQGGYLIAGFADKVVNSKGDYDIAIKGNPYSYQSEPGIVWVMKDENGDGLPNDTWYELAGSEYGTENEIFKYEITYYKPVAPQMDVQWKDNMGGEGIVPYMSMWNKHDYYWYDWVPTEKDEQGREYYTLKGSRLKDTHTYDVERDYTDEPPFAWGYADNAGSDYFKNPSFFPQSAMCYLKLSNAVTADGKPVNLDYVNFVKVQTGQTGASPNLGEISTEVHGIWRVKH